MLLVVVTIMCTETVCMTLTCPVLFTRNQGDVNGDGHIDLLVSQQGKYMVVVEVFVHVQQPNAH
tara:strand:+ start:1170 stop:1361 length:192 start_codon:yes stop_codon:yes gene_type:complete